MIERNTYFEKDIRDALDKKLAYEEHLRYVCNHLCRISPYDNKWYFNGNGFLQVDVSDDVLAEYLVFIEDLVECKYICLRNLNGVTLMISLSTLNDEYNRSL